MLMVSLFLQRELSNVIRNHWVKQSKMFFVQLFRASSMLTSIMNVQYNLSDGRKDLFAFCIGLFPE